MDYWITLSVVAIPDVFLNTMTVILAFQGRKYELGGCPEDTKHITEKVLERKIKIPAPHSLHVLCISGKSALQGAELAASAVSSCYKTAFKHVPLPLRFVSHLGV